MLEDYSRPRRNGIIAIKVDEDDELLGAALTNGNSTILLGARNGRAIRFLETDVRAMGRNTRGVRGINLNQDENDEVVDMVVVQNTNEATVLAISEHGYGKRSLVEDYREQSRGGKGVITLKRTEKTGDLVGLKEVSDVDDLMIITHKGKIIRMHCSDIRSMGRNTQGVRIMRLGNGDQISGVTRVVREEEAEEKAEDAIAKAEGEEGGSTPPDTDVSAGQQDSPDTGTDAADDDTEEDDTDQKD
jgi:DNA gyrase subunit A